MTCYIPTIVATKNTGCYEKLFKKYKKTQTELNRLKSNADMISSPSYTYGIVTTITNTWQLINLTYQNSIRNPFPLTPIELRNALLTPTLYQTNTDFLESVKYKYPVYTLVLRLDFKDSSLSTNVYNPIYSFGLNGYEMDKIAGNNLASTGLKAMTEQAKKRPISYQVQFAEYNFPTPDIKKNIFFMTYLPNPDKPYNNDDNSIDFNPFYIIVSGILL